MWCIRQENMKPCNLECDNRYLTAMLSFIHIDSIQVEMEYYSAIKFWKDYSWKARTFRWTSELLMCKTMSKYAVLQRTWHWIRLFKWSSLPSGKKVFWVCPSVIDYMLTMMLIPMILIQNIFTTICTSFMEMLFVIHGIYEIIKSISENIIEHVISWLAARKLPTIIPIYLIPL